MQDKDIEQSLRLLLLNELGVQQVHELQVHERLIRKIVFEKENAGPMELRCIHENDAALLFDLYFNGLSDRSRDFFGAPYPLFPAPLSSAEELAERISSWREEDDWTVLLLFLNSQLIGLVLLKRFKTDRPVTGIAIREDHHGMGLGTILQNIINEQAKVLGVKKLWSGAAQNNSASLKLHEKCGFRRTGKLVPHYAIVDGVKTLQREDVDLLKEFT